MSVYKLFLADVRQQEAGAKLRNSEAALRRTLQSLEHQKFALDQHAIVAITDVQGRITYVNAKFCEISGYAREELLGEDHILLNSGIHPKGFFKEMYRTVAHGQVWHGEICNRAKDGHLYWVSTTITPFMGENGKPDQYIAIRSDITQRKMVELELQQHRMSLEKLVALRTAELIAARNAAERANRAKSAFLSNMSHELRTPMHAILAFGRLGLEKSRGDVAPLPKLHMYYNHIVQSGDRLLQLISDLLDLSKLEAGKMTFNMSRHDLHKLVEEVVAEMKVLAAEKEIHIDSEAVPLDTSIDADALKVGQVLRNLLSNAIKFSAVGSTIRVSAKPAELGRRADDMVYRQGIAIDVIDAGIGIPEGELETVFDEFVQSSKTRTQAGGTGLGLPICRKIVDGHGGTIHAFNNPDGGSRFTFTLPLTQSI
jgi:polar amino acid transport system substrate-binding protein